MFVRTTPVGILRLLRSGGKISVLLIQGERLSPTLIGVGLKFLKFRIKFASSVLIALKSILPLLLQLLIHSEGTKFKLKPPAI